MTFDEQTRGAVIRLCNNPDFARFMAAISDEKNSLIKSLMGEMNTVAVHQLQGSSRQLEDIENAVMRAQIKDA